MDKFFFFLSFPLSPLDQEERGGGGGVIARSGSLSTNHGRASATQIVAVTIPHTRYHNNIRNHRID